MKLDDFLVGGKLEREHDWLFGNPNFPNAISKYVKSNRRVLKREVIFAQLIEFLITKKRLEMEHYYPFSQFIDHLFSKKWVEVPKSQATKDKFIFFGQVRDAATPYIDGVFYLPIGKPIATIGKYKIFKSVWLKYIDEDSKRFDHYYSDNSADIREIPFSPHLGGVYYFDKTDSYFIDTYDNNLIVTGFSEEERQDGLYKKFWDYLVKVKIMPLRQTSYSHLPDTSYSPAIKHDQINRIRTQCTEIDELKKLGEFDIVKRIDLNNQAILLEGMFTSKDNSAVIKHIKTFIKKELGG